jgi:hypothetical protein
VRRQTDTLDADAGVFATKTDGTGVVIELLNKGCLPEHWGGHPEKSTVRLLKIETRAPCDADT